MNEIFILKKLKNKNTQNFFVQLHDYYITINKQTNLKALFLVEELCLCNLNDIIRFRNEKNLGWAEDQKLYIMNHLIKGIEKAKTMGVCHRDIKPHNILFSNQGNLTVYKFGDFSEGKFLDEDEIEGGQGSQKRHTLRGTRGYMPPEMLEALSKNRDTLEYSPILCDLYSLGITFQQMAFEQADENRNTDQNSFRIVKQLTAGDASKRKNYQEIIKQIEPIKMDLEVDARYATMLLENRKKDENQNIQIKLVLALGYQQVHKMKEALEIYMDYL